MKRTTDVVIIGGGIMGTATAYQLAKRGIDVLLLEKSFLGAGSTGRTVGVIRQHYSLELTARMMLRSLQTWQAFDEVIGGDAGFVRTGGIFLAGHQGKVAMEATVSLQQSVGIRVELLNMDAMREISPYLDTDDFGAAAFEPDSGYADGSLACTAYASRARDLGATIKQGIEVTGIRINNGKIAGVDTTEGTVDAPVVVNTAGPWGMRLAKMVGIEVPAEASRHQIISFVQPKAFTPPDHPLLYDFVNGYAVRSETGGLTVGTSIEDHASDVVLNPDVYNTEIERPFIEKMVERTVRRIPAFERGAVQGGWAGLYTVTPDWQPVIDHLEAVPGFVFGLGFSGSGFKMAPVVSEMLADLATGQNACPIDSSPFRLSRFAEGALLKGEYSYSIVG
jgi:sarcosine oxidase subunit beta